MNREIRERCLRSLLRIHTNAEGTGMGVFLRGNRVVTAGHCLPLPPDCKADPFAERRTVVRVSAFANQDQIAPALCVFSNYDGDVAVLVPSDSTSANHDALWESLEPASPYLGPLRANVPVRVHLFTHEGKWVSGQGEVRDSISDRIFVRFEAGEEIYHGTSGAPAFTEDGRVIGIVSVSDEGEPTAELIRLAAGVPLRWILIDDDTWPFTEDQVKPE